MKEYNLSGRITSPADLQNLILKMGFLPFFQNDIPGFSVEEHTPPELWFSDTADGPWEWKGAAASGGKCVYGKFFRKKAGFISMEWFPDFANYWRDGYDFDARYEDGLVFYKDKTLYDAIEKNGSILTHELKNLCNYRKGGNKGFDTVITRLQMQTYITIADFEYKTDKTGKPYGWGIARYSTPEAQFGAEAVTAAYKRSPEDSRKRILAHLQKILPESVDKLKGMFKKNTGV